MVDGKIIQRLRMKYSVSQTELAKALNLHPKSIKNWEADISDPSADNLCALADYFHVTVDYLLGRDNGETISLAGISSAERQRLTAMIQAYLSVLRAQNQ